MKITIVNRVVLLLLFSGLIAAEGLPASAADTPVAALLLIDIQNVYFPSGRVELSGSDEAAQRASDVLKLFRRRGLPVLHVKHLPEALAGTSAAGSPEWSIHPRVAPEPGETIVVKHRVNAFLQTPLLEELKKTGATTVVCCGMQTHMCLEAAVRAAADLGYRVIVVGDACATRELTYQGVRVPASLVHASTLATIDGIYGRVVLSPRVEGLLNELTGKDAKGD